MRRTTTLTLLLATALAVALCAVPAAGAKPAAKPTAGPSVGAPFAATSARAAAARRGAATRRKAIRRARRARRGPKPRVLRVLPMRVQIGSRMVIRGRNFVARPRRNTVMFKGRGAQVVLARPLRATKRKLVLRVPRSATRLLTTARSSAAQPTRVRLRVISRRRAGKLTGRRLSPVMVGASSCERSDDSDSDLLPDSTELRYGLDPCNPDTDSDGLVDGWEYYSAKDLNVKAVPYPGKRPYPNPLQKDHRIDFDGDGLSAETEHALWRYTGSEFDASRLGLGTPGSPLGYSDGTQTSRPDVVPPAPAFKSTSYGLSFDPPPYPARLKVRPGPWHDDERDADVDGLNNFIEPYYPDEGDPNSYVDTGSGTFGWWKTWLEVKGVPPWPESYFGVFDRRPFVDVNIIDPDVDGDGLLDGEDDQDNDDIPNFTEMYDPEAIHAPTGNRKNAFNPCAPDTESRTCPLYVPLN